MNLGVLLSAVCRKPTCKASKVAHCMSCLIETAYLIVSEESSAPPKVPQLLKSVTKCQGLGPALVSSFVRGMGRQDMRLEDVELREISALTLFLCVSSLKSVNGSAWRVRVASR